MNEMRQIIVCVLLFSCSFLTQDCSQLQDHGTRKETSQSEIFGVEELYLTCLRESLPCECKEVAEWPIIIVDTSSLVAILYEHNGGFENIDLHKRNDHFFAYLGEGGSAVVFEFYTQKDTTILIKDGFRSKYIEHPPFSHPDKDWHMLGSVNMAILNLRLQQRGFDYVRKLDAESSLYLYCNEEIGKIDIISSHKCDDSWVVKNSKLNEILIYDYLNSCSPKVYPFAVEKSLIFTVSE